MSLSLEQLFQSLLLSGRRGGGGFQLFLYSVPSYPIQDPRGSEGNYCGEGHYQLNTQKGAMQIIIKCDLVTVIIFCLKDFLAFMQLTVHVQIIALSNC